MGVSKLHGRIARAAVSVALSGAMALGGIAGPAMTAFAAGSVTITTEDSSLETINGYQLFKGAVTDGTMSDVEYASGAKDKILAALGDEYIQWLKDNKYLAAEPTTTELDKAKNNASLALAYITKNISESGGATKTVGDNTVFAPAADSFATTLAKKLSASDVLPAQALTGSNKSFSESDLDTGYWLFLPTANDAVPIWMYVDGTNQTASVKSAASTLAKTVSEDGGTTFTEFVDAGMGQIVTFRLIADIKTGADDFKITDTLPAGMDLVNNSGVEGDVSDITIKNASGGDVKANFATPVFENSILTISNKDASTRLAVGTYTIEYKAKINSNATMGIAAANRNTNTAVLHYDGQDSLADTANVISYQIEVDKVDKDNNAPLKGSVFTIQKGEKYVQADGSLADTEYNFTTGEDGKINAPRLDAGEYTVKEVEAPSGYALDSTLHDTGVKIKIGTAFDAATGEALSSYAAYVEGLSGVTRATVDLDAGLVTVAIPNAKQVTLPVTGMTPSQLGTIIGGALVAAGAVAIAMRRRNAEQA